MIKKQITVLMTILVSLLISAAPVFAHAVVKPNTAGIGAFTDFTLGVPSEKDVATTRVKLMIPDGINSVSPIVKPGWKVEVINSAQQGQPDDDGMVHPIPEAIVWTGGSIPAEQKDFFMFSTQVPAKETELDWKVEQTYADGSIVSWTKSADEQPKDEKGNPDFSKFGPFSKTMVVNDLTAPSQSGNSSNANSTAQGANQSNSLLTLGVIIAFLMSGASLWMQMRKKA